MRTARNDRAVSTVLAAMLLIALAAVLSVGLYVWMSATGAEASTSSRHVTLTSGSPLLWTGADQVKTYTVAYASQGLAWSELRLTLDGAGLPYDENATPGGTSWRMHAHGAVLSSAEAATALVSPGDEIELALGGGHAGGRMLRVVSAAENAVLVTVSLA
jgi:FlaG/FlaF family flagellin (archaellin)